MIVSHQNTKPTHRISLAVREQAINTTALLSEQDCSKQQPHRHDPLLYLEGFVEHGPLA
jgi:hypothetical protein